MSLSTTPETLKPLLLRTESEQLLSEYNIAKSIRMKDIRNKLKSLRSSDPGFWSTAAKLAGCKIKALEAETKYLEVRQLHDPDDDPDEYDLIRWADSMKWKVKAAMLEKQLYTTIADRPARVGVVSISFACLLRTYQGTAGMGRPSRAEHVKFRQSLLTAYDAGMYRVVQSGNHRHLDLIFDPATGTHRDASSMVAAHIVPYKLGSDTMYALFPWLWPSDAEVDLFSPYNGLLLPYAVARALDHGALAIVPNLDDKALESTQVLAEWELENHHPKEYKWMVIDEKAKYLLDALFMGPWSQPDDPRTWMTVRELGGKPLHFRPGANGHRPRTRLLYFAFVLSVLKTVWRCNSRAERQVILKKLVDKTWWTWEGRYLNQALLFALEEEGNMPPRPVSDMIEAQEKAEIALLAVTRAFDIRKTRLEEQAAKKLGDEEDEFDDNGYRLPYWELSKEEAEKVAEGEDEVHDDDDDDDEEEEEWSDDNNSYGDSDWDFCAEHV